MKILHIDDNKSITEVFAKVLPLKGHDYSAVHNGVDGAKEILTGKYDFIILDLSMPQFSGFDVIDEVTNKAGTVSNIVILTAVSMGKSEQERLNSLGIKRIISKPISLTKLLEEINQFKSLVTT